MDETHSIHASEARFGTSRRPLLGLTFLLVEDSRYCSEAVRLMCLKSGARLRRADSLRAAYRHLATYRPSVVLIDIGLPDGSGVDMIRDLATHRPNAPLILATSGDDPAEFGPKAMAAGADGFIAKPLKNLEGFQQAILKHFPDRLRNLAENVLSFSPEIRPDPLAMKEDLRHVLTLIEEVALDGDRETQDYCAQFLGSVAEAAGDSDLRQCARRIADSLTESGHSNGVLRDVVPVLKDRMQAMRAL